MKKIFLLISVLVIAVFANATVINITPTSPHGTHDNLRLALYYASAGDEIVVADGTYLEKDNYLYFDKDIIVRAADGASPIIQMYTYAQIKSSANVTIEGLTFDGSAQGSYDYYFRFYDATHTSLILENCEFYSVKNYVLFGNSASHTDSLKVNNCYFHDNKKNAVYFEASGTSGVQTCDKLVFTNSTVAKSDSLENYTSTIDIRPYGTDDTDAIKVIIDHCTFYDNPTINTDHSSIRPYHLTDVTISNCIFVKGPNQKEKRNATSCYGGTISNCLVYDLNYSSNGHRSGPTVTNNTIADPLFNDLANNKYTYYGNWSTGSISPAIEAATNGTNLGDPRWYRDNEVLPSSSIASSYDLLSTKAQLTGDVKFNASNHIEYKGTTTPGTVKWKLHVGRKCIISAIVDRETGSTSGCKLTLTVKDADGNSVGALAMASGSYSDADINLPGTITFPEEGDYTLILTNSTANSGAILEKITLSYEGGAIQNISTSTNTTLNVADAWFSGCTRDNEKTYIQYPSSSTSSAWMKWNIATSETKYYDLTVNINTEYAHGFTVAIYEDEEADPIASVTEGSYVNTKGDGLALEVGRVNLVGGKNYVVKVTNAPDGSQAKVTSVVFAPVAASATELPNTLAFADAVLSAKAHITGGMLYFNEIGDTDPRGQWAQWEVTTDHDGLFIFTMGVTSTNEQTYKITIKDDSDNEIDFYESSPGSGDKTLTHYFALETGSYFVKVENTRSYSKGHLTSLVVTEPEPGDVMTIDEAATDNTSWSDKVVADDAVSPTYNVQIIRTLKANMYNTFCLPFRVPDNMCKDLFGSDVEIYTLKEAIVDDNILNLELNKSSDVWQGTPVFIKPSRNIVNPVFSDVVFKRLVPSATTKTNANFTGSFVATTLGPDPDILFLAQDNMLYYPQEKIPILGMRGWLVLHDSPAPISPRRANFILPDKMPTAIEIVNGDILPLDKTMKVIENDQLIIIRDGIRYNVMGIRVK